MTHLGTGDLDRLLQTWQEGHLLREGALVAIAVASPHRAEAFEACRFAIDTLKVTVPIWKREVATDGAYWVDDHA